MHFNFGSAPHCSRKVTILSCPSLAARCSADIPCHIRTEQSLTHIFEANFSLDLPCGTPPRGQHAHIISGPSHEDTLEKKRKDYAFRRQFNEKPSIIPGCPGEGTLQKRLSVPRKYLIVLYTQWHALSQQVLSHCHLASFGRQVQRSHALQAHMLLLDSGTM